MPLASRRETWGATLFVKKNNKYSNSPPALAFLSKESEQYLGFMIMHHHHLMESWHKMDKAVVEGGPNRVSASFSDEERRKNYLVGQRGHLNENLRF